MKVNSAKEYRKWVKLQEDRPEVIEDFMHRGLLHLL